MGKKSEKLQSKVLEELHTAHPGVVRMKSIARIHVWWPGVNKKIEEVVKGCLPCQSNKNNSPLTSLHLWNWPSQPWHRLHHIQKCTCVIGHRKLRKNLMNA